MADFFDDGVEALKTLVATHGIKGNWTEDANGKHAFRSRDRGILNYWPSSGKIHYQGRPDAQTKLRAIFKNEPQVAAPVGKAVTADGRTKIFIVHGHDDQAREQLELILRRLELEPFILQNNYGGGNTIIEALEQQIYEEAAFGIVLMTPDDYGYPKSKAEELKLRARQNVILEMGMVLASLGRDRMAILKKGVLEHPSDVDGVLRLDFNDHVKEVAVRLATRMKKEGIDIDDSLIAQCSA